jgi:uncharacterized protein
MRWRLPVAALVAMVVALGLARTGFDVEILSMLPPGLRQVESLRLWLANFSRPDDLIVTVEGPDAATTRRAAGDIAAALGQNPALSSGVEAEPPWESDPGGFPSFAAWAALNGPPDGFADALGRLTSPDSRRAALDETIETLATTPSPLDLALLPSDPYRLAAPVLRAAAATSRGADGFSSADGTFRMLFVSKPDGVGGRSALGDWIERVRDAAVSAGGSAVSIGITGEPAFLVEISRTMERDMAFSGVATLFIAGLLFRAFNGRLKPMFLLLGILILGFVATLGIGGLVLGRITALGVGCAAILIGLGVDYGYFIQRTALGGNASTASLRRRSLATIGWTCGTTSAAFFALNLGGIPGLSQLGTLVGIGIPVVAGLMLWLFAPVARASAMGQPSHHRLDTLLSSPLAARAGFVACLACLPVLLGALVWKGPPGMDFSPDKLRPRTSGAYDAFAVMTERLAGGKDSCAFLVTGTSMEETGARLESVGRLLEDAFRTGEVESFACPDFLWPSDANQRANLAALRASLPDPSALAASLEAAGFDAGAFGLTDAILGHWREWSLSEPPVDPPAGMASGILERFAVFGDGLFIASGTLTPAPGHDPASLPWVEGAVPTGWELLGAELAGTVPGRLAAVLAGLVLVVVLLLGIALRSLAALGLFCAAILLSTACLAGAMTLLGMDWNLFSLAALLLLMGTGTDYAIMVLLSLRRNGGDTAKTRQELHPVILQCVISAAAGFGSISLANHAGLASLGATCAAGLMINAAVALYLLPPAASWLLRKTAIATAPRP